MTDDIISRPGILEGSSCGRIAPYQSSENSTRSSRCGEGYPLGRGDNARPRRVERARKVLEAQQSSEVTNDAALDIACTERSVCLFGGLREDRVLSFEFPTRDLDESTAERSVSKKADIRVTR